MLRNLMLSARWPTPLWQGAGEGGAGGAGDPPPANDPPPNNPPPPAKWFESADFNDEERQYLSARGLAEDDPLKALPKLVKAHRNAEQRIGRGLDSIIDKPGKDQKLSEYLRANAATFGLPDKEDAYAAEPPDFWPKDAKWDGDLEAKARKIAFEHGVSPEAHKAYVNAFAEKMKGYHDEATGTLDAARAQMMQTLQRDFGDQTQAKITLAKQAAQAMAEKAGIGAEELGRISGVLAEGTGDAGVIRLFAAIGEAMGEDKAVALGKGGTLTMTPADARAELARFESPEGEYGKAFGAGDAARMAELRPRREQLARIAAGGR